MMNMPARQVNRFLLLLGFLVLFLLTDCNLERGNNTDPLPPNLIPSDTLVKILVDVHLIEASLKIKHTKKPDNERFTNLYYNQLFNKYGITREQLNQSLTYYQRHAEIFDKIYEQVITELNKLESQVK